MIDLILKFLVAWAAVAAFTCTFGPITIWVPRHSMKANAKNMPCLILMKRGIDNPGAVWAQECYESRFCAITLPFWFVLGIIGRIYPRRAGYERGVEYQGHAVKAAVLESLTSVKIYVIIEREAGNLYGYRAFRGYSVKFIEGRIWHHLDASRKWVGRNWARIERMQERGMRK